MQTGLFIFFSTCVFSFLQQFFTFSTVVLTHNCYSTLLLLQECPAVNVHLIPCYFIYIILAQYLTPITHLNINITSNPLFNLKEQRMKQ